MVDATASFSGLRPGLHSATGSVQKNSASPAWVVSHADGEAMATYRQLAAHATVSPSQSSGWVSVWMRHAGSDGVIAIARIGGEPVMGLALEIVRQGPFKVARFAGGRHACGNFPPVLPRLQVEDIPETMSGLCRALRDSRPDIDLVSLERLAHEIAGVRNPLLELPHLKSPNVALAVNLDGGFEGLLSRSSGKRKKKKHRSQTRKFEAVGQHRRIQAASPEEVDRFLGAFFEMKESRFRQKGIEDVFAPPGVRSFFRALFSEALAQPNPPFVIHALEVAGKIRAVTGSSIEGRRVICQFGAIADDDLAHASPGDFLFFDNIKEACDRGFGIYDFSVGDEPYKRLWCDLVTEQADAYRGLSAKGHALAAFMRLQNRAKGFVKTSPIVWKLAKAFRQRKAAVVEADE